jgi:hypothetical protein
LEFIIEHYPQLFDDSGMIISEHKASQMEAALSAWMGGGGEDEPEENVPVGKSEKKRFFRKDKKSKEEPSTTPDYKRTKSTADDISRKNRHSASYAQPIPMDETKIKNLCSTRSNTSHELDFAQSVLISPRKNSSPINPITTPNQSAPTVSHSVSPSTSYAPTSTAAITPPPIRPSGPPPLPPALPPPPPLAANLPPPLVLTQEHLNALKIQSKD